MTDRDFDFEEAPDYSKLTFKAPEYECPVHGSITNTITFHRADTGKARTFCVECCFDKIVEIGVCEVVEKKP